MSVGQHPVGLDPLAAGLRPLGGAGSYGWTSWRGPSPPREGAGSSVHSACPAPRLVALLLPMGRGDRPTPPESPLPAGMCPPLAVPHRSCANVNAGSKVTVTFRGRAGRKTTGQQ